MFPPEGAGITEQRSGRTVQVLPCRLQQQSIPIFRRALARGLRAARRARGPLQTYVGVSLGAFHKRQNGSAGRPLHVISHLRLHAPAQEIAQLAADLEADLVVVGMHGNGSFVRFILGSVAENVTRLAPCPVLVFRPKGLPPEYPKLEPPCPRCVEARTSSGGKGYWCPQHRERHGQRLSYHKINSMSQDGSLPLFFQE